MRPVRQWGSVMLPGRWSWRWKASDGSRNPVVARSDRGGRGSAIAGIVATTVPLLVLGFISHARWRLPLAAVAVAVAFAVAGSKGIVMLEDLWVLPLGIGMTDQLILLLL